MSIRIPGGSGESAAHFFKRAFHVAYVGGAARPVDGDGRGEAVESGHRRRKSIAKLVCYAIVFHGEKQ